MGAPFADDSQTVAPLLRAIHVKAYRLLQTAETCKD